MCDHLEFTARVEIHRLEDTQDGESLACQVDVTAACAVCKAPLQFALPMGMSLVEGAWMSADGREARLPARIGIPRVPGHVQGFRLHAGQEVL